MRWVDGITDSMDVSLSKLGEWWWTGRPGVLRSTGSQESDMTERLNSNNHTSICGTLILGGMGSVSQRSLLTADVLNLSCRLEILESF